MVNVNGRMSPTGGLILFLVIMLALPLLNLLGDSGDSMAQFEEFMENPIMKWGMLILQGGASVFMFIGLPCVFLLIAGANIKQIFLKNLRFDLPLYLMVGLLVIVFMPVNGWIAELNTKIPFPEGIVRMEEMAGELTKALTNFDSTAQFILGIIVIAVVAGIGEEFAFRGILQNQFNQVVGNYHIGIWLSAIVFSAIHMQFLGFFPRMLLGAFFGYLYVWTGNLSLAMFAHFVNNAFAVIAMHLYNTKAIDVDLDNQEEIPMSTVIGSVVLTIGLGYTIWKYIHNKGLTPEKEAKSQPVDELSQLV